MATAAAPPMLADITNMVTAPPLPRPPKIDSDENESSEPRSSKGAAYYSTDGENDAPRHPGPAHGNRHQLGVPLSRLELTPFLYGHGTELTPITEQRSIATLRNGIVSTPDLDATRKFSNTLHKKSTLENVQESPVSPGRLLRRQQSFSLDSGKSHILQTRQRYQEALHRKEITITSDSSSSSSAAGTGGGGSAIDTARILAEIKSYPHHPPFSPLTQVVTPPEYYEWALSHPIAARNPNHLLQRHGSRRGGGHGGDLLQHPFVRIHKQSTAATAAAVVISNVPEMRPTRHRTLEALAKSPGATPTTTSSQAATRRRRGGGGGGRG
ncbi:RNA polymerase II transcription factor B subunit 1 [Apiospora sp. TS-2023a]